MRQDTHFINRAPARFLAALSLLVLCAAFGAALAQSGRRTPKPISPPPQPEASPTEPGFSESQPKGKRSTDTQKPLLSFVVFEDDDPFLSVQYVNGNPAFEGFVNRLRESSSIAVMSAGRSNRKDARDRAKNETTDYVVLFQLEDLAEEVGRGGVGPTNPNYLIVKFYVYEPRTGALKHQGRIEQRPYRPMTSIGGVRVPMPGPTRSAGRLEVEYRLEQAGYDAANRLMSYFDIILPPGR